MSVPLARELYNNHWINVVGTLRKNKPEISASFIDGKIRPPLSSLFVYQNDSTSVSYMQKKHLILLLSTFHDTDKTDAELAVKKKYHTMSTKEV